MTTATAKGVPYPQATDPANVPADLGSLAAWIDAHAWGGVQTTTQRDLLSGTNLWAGMVIFNSTLGRLEINPSGSAGSANWAAAFVIPAAGTLAPLMDGAVAVGTSSAFAREDHGHPTDSSRAPLASPAFTGTPTVPTASAGTETTQAASTAFVLAQLLAGLANEKLIAPTEMWTLSATAATGTVNFDCTTQGVLYYTTNATANWTLNFRGSADVTLASMLAVGSPITLIFVNTNGATPYIPNAFTIDGVTVTPKWSGGTAPSAGNASAIDVYQFTIIKTATTPTYTVLAAGPVKYA